MCRSRFRHVSLRWFFFLLVPRPPASTLFPYTTLFRSFRSMFKGSALFGQPLSEFGLAAVAVPLGRDPFALMPRSEEHTSELQSQFHLVCRLLLEKKNAGARQSAPRRRRRRDGLQLHQL